MNKIPAGVLDEALRILGGKKQPKERLLPELEKAYGELLSVCVPRSVYNILPVKAEGNGILLDGSVELKSKDLKKLFENCEEAVLLAVTLGFETDRLLREKMTSDMPAAVILDALASAETERLCSILEGKLMQSLRGKKHLTMRFSPGYGDVPLEYSSILVKLLNTQKYIGLSTSASHMLVPTKSVVALLGLSRKKENRKITCEKCAINSSCYYKKRGERCGV